MFKFSELSKNGAGVSEVYEDNDDYKIFTCEKDFNKDRYDYFELMYTCPPRSRSFKRSSRIVISGLGRYTYLHQSTLFSRLTRSIYAYKFKHLKRPKRGDIK